jgi:hypothetical protein
LRHRMEITTEVFTDHVSRCRDRVWMPLVDADSGGEVHRPLLPYPSGDIVKGMGGDQQRSVLLPFRG